MEDKLLNCLPTSLGADKAKVEHLKEIALDCMSKITTP